MKKLNLKIVVVALIFLIVGGLFYWTQIRPGQIRKYCIDDAGQFLKAHTGESKTMEEAQNRLNMRYRICLVKNGLKAEDILE